MLELHTLRAPRGAKKRKKRKGQGPGSGLGKTAGRGQKGQTSRSGFHQYPGFEGGQMPLHRRLPKRGFRNPGKRRYAVINLDQLEGRFTPEEPVTPELLRRRGLVKNLRDGLKILGRGELHSPLTIVAHAFSREARKKIEAAGGRAEVLD